MCPGSIRIKRWTKTVVVVNSQNYSDCWLWKVSNKIIYNTCKRVYSQSGTIKNEKFRPASEQPRLAHNNNHKRFLWQKKPRKFSLWEHKHVRNAAHVTYSSIVGVFYVIICIDTIANLKCLKVRFQIIRGWLLQIRTKFCNSNSSSLNRLKKFLTNCYY